MNEGRAGEKDPLYYEHIGGDFDRFMSDYDVSRRLELVLSQLPADAGSLACLEVGCGTGRISAGLIERVGELTVLDISERLAKDVGEDLGVAWLQGDACNLPVADRSFPLVVSSECIEHTPDPARALREMARVVAPGGTVILTTPNRLWYPVLLLAMRLGIRKFQGTENWLSPGAIHRELAAAGLRVVTMTGCHLFPWHLPLAKSVLPWLDRFGTRLYPMMINVAAVARLDEVRGADPVTPDSGAAPSAAASP